MFDFRKLWALTETNTLRSVFNKVGVNIDRGLFLIRTQGGHGSLSFKFMFNGS